MKKYTFTLIALAVLVATNIFSFSQGYFLGKIDTDFLFASNNARFSAERLQLLESPSDDAIQEIIYSDQETLSRVINYYGMYLENGSNHFHKYFILDFPQLYFYKSQYEDWVNEATLYRIKNPILINELPANPFRSELEFYLSQGDLFSKSQIDSLKERADYYDQAIQHVEELEK